MKVAVIGSRSIANADLKRYIPPDATVIISGGAVGVDALADGDGIEVQILLHIDHPFFFSQQGRSNLII